MKAVFDTNVFISALVFGGIPRNILLLADEGRFELVISKQILAELRGILRTKFRYEKRVLDEVETMLTSVGMVVDPKRKIRRITADPEDNMVLECAVEGEVEYIVSGDKHLLELKTYRRVKILSPASFYDTIQNI